MSDAMGVQGFHPYRNSRNHKQALGIMARLIAFKHDNVHVLIYEEGVHITIASVHEKGMWTLNTFNTHWIQP